MTLKELQAKRQELGSQYRAIVKDTAEWTPEITEKREKIWADYEANLAELETEKATIEADLQRETEMAANLGAIDGYQDFSPSSGASPLARLGRDNGDLAGGDRGGNGHVEEDRVLAFNAWVNMSGVRDVTNEQMEACQRLRFNPAAQALEFNIGQQNRFAQVRSLINQMPGLDPADKVAALSSGRFQNALSAVTGATGGYTVPEGFINTLEINMVAFGGMLQAADIWRTDSGNEVPWPTASDTDNTGEIVAESSDQDGSTDPTFAAVIFGATKYSSKMVKIPEELIEDSAFDISSVIGAMLGERLGRITNTMMTTGTGAAPQPKGIVTAATTGVTTASDTAITWDEIYDLEHSIDPAYRNGASFMAHDTIIKYLRKLKNGEGEPIWAENWNTGRPDTINGYPYTVNQDMSSTITSGDKTLLFGQMKKFKIRQVRGIRMKRFLERYGEKDQIALIAFLRQDGNLVDAGTAPIKVMVQA